MPTFFSNVPMYWRITGYCRSSEAWSRIILCATLYWLNWLDLESGRITTWWCWYFRGKFFAVSFYIVQMISGPWHFFQCLLLAQIFYNVYFIDLRNTSYLIFMHYLFPRLLLCLRTWTQLTSIIGESKKIEDKYINGTPLGRSAFHVVGNAKCLSYTVNYCLNL